MGDAEGYGGTSPRKRKATCLVVRQRKSLPEKDLVVACEAGHSIVEICESGQAMEENHEPSLHNLVDRGQLMAESSAARWCFPQKPAPSGLRRFRAPGRLRPPRQLRRRPAVSCRRLSGLTVDFSLPAWCNPHHGAGAFRRQARKEGDEHVVVGRPDGTALPAPGGRLGLKLPAPSAPRRGPVEDLCAFAPGW